MIPLYRPWLTARERSYVSDCMETSWISSRGQYIDRFEEKLCEFTGARAAVSVFNGTVALELSLRALGIGPGDEVIVPTFTYIASVNSILSVGATPVFVDSRESDWLIDVAAVEQKITARTRAVMPVPLYGYPYEEAKLQSLTETYDLLVIADTAECLGVFVAGTHLGLSADLSTFSFFGNKTFTCGEGGAVLVQNSELEDRLRLIKNHGMSPTRRYWHEEVGSNHRMTNIQAAIGLAQLERADEIVEQKIRVYEEYRSQLSDLPLVWQETSLPDVKTPHWLVSVLLNDGAQRDKAIHRLAERGIETRPVFECAHKMPYLEGYHSPTDRFDVAVSLSKKGISLPSYPELSNQEIHQVASELRNIL